MQIQRPQPPAWLFELGTPDCFLPAPEIDTWFRSAFLVEASPLFNDEHLHLTEARIGFAWTTYSNERQMRRVVGQAQLAAAPSSLNKWAKARYEQQTREWWGDEQLDFTIYLDANYCRAVSDIVWCALVEHELYHCAQAFDKYGAPAFSRETGRPKYAMRGHDVEEFVGIVRRYGVGAAAGETMALVMAAKEKPEVGAADIAGMCGNCLRLV